MKTSNTRLNPDDIRSILDSSQGLKDSYLCRRLSFTEKQLNQLLESGTDDPVVIRRLRLFKQNQDAKLNFDYSEIVKLQDLLAYNDVDMQLLFDITPKAWLDLKKGTVKKVPSNLRMLTILLTWVVKDLGLEIEELDLGQLSNTA